MNKVEQLIISSTIDYSTDLISCEFEKRGFNYLRLNRDRFSEYDILYNLGDDGLSVAMDSKHSLNPVIKFGPTEKVIKNAACWL